MAYALDGVLLLVFGFSVWLGYRRGFIRSVSGTASFLAALAVSMLLSAPLASLVNEAVVQPRMEQTVAPYIDGVFDSVEEAGDKALETLPAFVTALLEKKGITDGADIMALTDTWQDRNDLSYQIADQVVAPALLPFVEAVCAFLLFLLTYMAACLLLRALNVTAKLPLLKQLNTGLGVAVGVVSGLLWVLAAANVFQLVAAVAPADFAVNPAVLSETLLTRRVVGATPLVFRELIAVSD